MPNQPYYFPKLPETATVAYYDAETYQNLTAEEWNKLNPMVNPSEVRIINQGETYVSWKAGVDYPAYGPVTTQILEVMEIFNLKIECHNWHGRGGIMTACSSSEALYIAHSLEDNNWDDSHVISDSVLHKCAVLVREAVQHYKNGNEVMGYVKVKGKFWGDYEWSVSY